MARAIRPLRLAYCRVPNMPPTAYMLSSVTPPGLDGFWRCLLLALGFSRNSAFLRWQALLLLALSIGKVFLVDVSELSQGYRILSFLGLGALLLGVSFVYQRDWFNLRGKGSTL